MTWHLDAVALERYRTGQLDRGGAASVEAHVTGCAVCRALVPAEEVRDEAVWSAVFPRVAAPPATVVERILGRLGVPGHIGRLVVLPRSTGLPWFIATAVVLAFAMFSARWSIAGSPSVWLLVVAPLAPVIGVATAYGRLASPSFELELAAPIDAFRLVLLRSVAVTSVALALAFAADLASPGGGFTGAWLVPSLALVVATLALGTRMRLVLAAASVAGVWLVVVVLATTSVGVLAVFGAVGQVGHLALLLLAAAVLTRRYGTFDQGVTA